MDETDDALRNLTPLGKERVGFGIDTGGLVVIDGTCLYFFIQNGFLVHMHTFYVFKRLASNLSGDMKTEIYL